MTVYFKCLCRPKDKLLAKKFRDEGHEVKVTNHIPKWRDEAKQYGLKLPFIVEDGKARPL